MGNHRRTESVEVDENDRRLIEALDRNARTAIAALARLIGLSPQSTSDRVKRGHHHRIPPPGRAEASIGDRARASRYLADDAGAGVETTGPLTMRQVIAVDRQSD